MEEVKEMIKTYNRNYLQPLHYIGELNFIRTENDLVNVCLNVLHSTKILMQLIVVLRSKEFPVKYGHLLMGHLKQIEQSIAKIMVHLNKTFDTKEIVCIPATCITFECIKKILVNIIMQLYTFVDNRITNKIVEDNLISLIIQVLLIINNR